MTWSLIVFHEATEWAKTFSGLSTARMNSLVHDALAQGLGVDVALEEEGIHA